MSIVGKMLSLRQRVCRVCPRVQIVIAGSSFNHYLAISHVAQYYMKYIKLIKLILNQFESILFMLELTGEEAHHLRTRKA